MAYVLNGSVLSIIIAAVQHSKLGVLLNISPPSLHINLPEITNGHLGNGQQRTSLCFSQSEYSQW